MLNYFKTLSAIAKTRKELERLSDRELTDLGISRHDIYAIARQSVTA